MDFAFFFHRVQAFYGMDYERVLKLPFRVFWSMSNTIDRIKAQDDLRALAVASCAQSGEAAREHRTVLLEQIGSIIRHDDTIRDEEGFSELKALQKSET